MHRRNFLRMAGAASVARSTDAAWSRAAGGPAGPSGDITALATQMAAGRLSSERLTRHYLDRIEALNRRGPCLHAVIEINPQALDIAASLDRERSAQGARGPLHGMPILDQGQYRDRRPDDDHRRLLALEGWYAPEDAPLIARLRAAGAVILGKTNMSEWANFRSTHSSAAGAGAAARQETPTRSIAIHPARAPDRRSRSRRSSVRRRSVPRRMARS